MSPVYSKEEMEEVFKNLPNAVFYSLGVKEGYELAYEDCHVTAEKIKRLRESHKLSLVEFSKEIGWALSNCEDWENCKITPPRSALLEIANFFEVSEEYLRTSGEGTQLSLF